MDQKSNHCVSTGSNGDASRPSGYDPTSIDRTSVWASHRERWGHCTSYIPASDIWNRERG